jgi:hypothetical protein
MPNPRLPKLQNGPNGNVMRSDTGAAQKLMEILVHASFRHCLHIVEGGIDIGSRTAI